MTDEGGEGRWWEPLSLCFDPIKVQGITVSPGDEVLVRVGGVDHPHVYRGYSIIPTGMDMELGLDAPPTSGDGVEEPSIGYWVNCPPGSGPGMWPGPYRLRQLRHPNLLEGIVREIDSAD